MRLNNLLLFQIIFKMHIVVIHNLTHVHLSDANKSYLLTQTLFYSQTKATPPLFPTQAVPVPSLDDIGG